MVFKKLTVVAAALAVSGLVALAGCGDDDDGDSPKTDGGGDVVIPVNEGGTDGGDGGACTFQSFVTGLINNSTTATALPSTDLGDKCPDNGQLFPQTIF